MENSKNRRVFTLRPEKRWEINECGRISFRAKNSSYYAEFYVCNAREFVSLKNLLLKTSHGTDFYIYIHSVKQSAGEKFGAGTRVFVASLQ